MIRRRLHPLAAALLVGMLSASEDFHASPPPLPRQKPVGPDLTAFELLEWDLLHAEEALDRARTPGARRKAQRKVNALRAQLNRYTRGGVAESAVAERLELPQHTPGPWTVKRQASNYALYGIKEAHDRARAAEAEGGDWLREAAANTALIAAAPDLLAVLMEMTALAEGPVGGVTAEMKRAIIAKARSAIALATLSTSEVTGG